MVTGTSSGTWPVNSVIPAKITSSASRAAANAAMSPTACSWLIREGRLMIAP